jgi:hypothetical protein
MQFPPKYTPPPTYNQSLPANVNQLTWSEAHSKVDKELINKSLINYSATRSSSARDWNVSHPSLTARFGWNPPMLGPLPVDFLRFDAPTSSASPAITIAAQSGASVVDAESASSAAGTSPLSSTLLQQKMQENERQRLQLASNLEDGEAAQYLEDERIAIFLQNEEFVSELRRNKEFMSALNYDAMRGRSHTSQSSSVNGFCNENYTGDSTGNAQYEPVPHETDADFKEKLKSMGKASRRKFAQVGEGHA